MARASSARSGGRACPSSCTRTRGLVVVSSCSHAGVIDALRNVARVKGVPKVHGFVGGLHLTGGLFEPIIPRTVEAIAGIVPDVVVPGHCTG